jgi:nucleoside triphosphate pyrophosphatase
LSNNIPVQELVLASCSPRRAEILEAVGWPFITAASGVDEKRRTGEDAISYVRRLAEAKARMVSEKFIGRLVLGADTVVVVHGKVLGQPQNQDDAKRMLNLLSGGWHDVLTGVALVRAGEHPCAMVDQEITRVRFGPLSSAEIEWYVSTGEPMDKAGAYAIQGKAAPLIQEIQGDYFNIVGLPIRLVYQMLQDLED